MPRSKVAALVVVTLFLGLVGPGPAGAHTEVLDADPEPGGTAPVGRKEVTMTFSALDREVPAEIDVLGPDGGSIVTGSPIVVEGDPGAGTTVAVPVEPLGEGRHEVRWEVFSDDGDPSTGSFEFTAEDSDSVFGLWLLWAAALAVTVALLAGPWLRRRFDGPDR